MTKEEKIKLLYNAIAAHASAGWGSGSQARVKCIQKHLNTIKKLLEPEPETLAASVLRLTDTCNELQADIAKQKRFAATLRGDRSRLMAKNATLRNDLTDMTLDFNDTNSVCRKLEEEIVRKNDTLKRAHDNLEWLKKAYEEELTDAWARAAHRKKLLAEAKERIEALEKNLATRERYIELLNQDLTTLTRQSWRRGK